VVSPLGEPITTNPSVVNSVPSRQTSPIATSSASGGIAGIDDKGSSLGGRETVTWPNGFPAGRFDYGVKYNTGQSPANYNLDVLVNGVTLDPATSGTLTGPNTQSEFEGNAVEITNVPTVAVSSAQAVSKKKK